MIIHGIAIQRGIITWGLLLFATMALAETAPFQTRSGRGTHSIPPGYGPRGPVGPSDSEVAAESPVATVNGTGWKGAPYQAFPPDDSGAFVKALNEQGRAEHRY